MHKKLLKEWMKINHKCSEDFARLIPCHPVTIDRYLKGNSKTQRFMLIRIEEEIEKLNMDEDKKEKEWRHG